jgi:hypothetical protein
MAENSLLPVSRQHVGRLLARDPAPFHSALERRLPAAPTGFFLAGDLMTVKHAGQAIEGVGRHYDSSKKGMLWGHTYLSSALVAPGMDPYLLRCDPFLGARMATIAYPQLTPSEALLNIVGDVLVAGYKLMGVLADAQFSSHLNLRSLKALRVPFVMRFRTNAKVVFEGQQVRVKDLAERFPPGRVRYYPELDRYVKRVGVVIDEVGAVELLLVWNRQGLAWHLTALVSTLEGGVQAVMAAWSARWSLEVTHRQRKQELGLGSCQSRKYATHLRHADLTIDAFNEAREERARRPGLTWKTARELAAERLEKAIVTGINPIPA